ncbi:MAG: cation diffusion facilitator family transporter [Rickettsiales bacterium]
MTKINHKDFLVKLATNCSMFVAIVIVSAKVFAWFYTSSATILASLADSVLDVFSSLINFIAARYAIQPPDNEHRFGHGKAEDIAVYTQASIFAASGIFIFVVSIKRMLDPVTIEHGTIGILVMVFSIILTILLIAFQSYVVKKTQSKIVKADKLHFSVDLLSNLAVIVALVMTSFFGNMYIDPIFAICIAFYIFYGAVKLLRDAFKNLMDHEMDDEDRNMIKKIISDNKKIKGFHDLKTRHSGRRAVIQFHLEMDGRMTLYDAHKISDEIEKGILKLFGDADIIIHQDPCEINEEVEFLS